MPVKVTDIAKWKESARCKRRYGRATLTILRSGGLDELIGRSEVAQTIDAFRSGEATSEDVTWAFVRGRVESHSPSFTWKTADLKKVIALVAGCSETPKLTATEPDELATALLRAQEDQREQLSETFKAISRSIAGTAGLMAHTAALRSLSVFTREQGQAVRKALAPVMEAQTAWASQVASMRAFSPRITLPEQAHSEVARTLARTVTASHMQQSQVPGLAALIRHRTVSIQEVAAATSDAARLSAISGHSQEAQQLGSIAVRMSSAIDAPSPRTIEDLVEDVAERVGELEEELGQTRNEQAERDVERDERDQARFEIAIYLTVLLFLLQWLLDMLQTAPPPTN
jgi:hypothetical protein